jgi:hypothetical protein
MLCAAGYWLAVVGYCLLVTQTENAGPRNAVNSHKKHEETQKLETQAFE